MIEHQLINPWFNLQTYIHPRFLLNLGFIFLVLTAFMFINSRLWHIEPDLGFGVRTHIIRNNKKILRDFELLMFYYV